MRLLVTYLPRIGAQTALIALLDKGQGCIQLIFFLAKYINHCGYRIENNKSLVTFVCLAMYGKQGSNTSSGDKIYCKQASVILYGWTGVQIIRSIIDCRVYKTLPYNRFYHLTKCCSEARNIMIVWSLVDHTLRDKRMSLAIYYFRFIFFYHRYSNVFFKNNFLRPAKLHPHNAPDLIPLMTSYDNLYRVKYIGNSSIANIMNVWFSSLGTNRKKNLKFKNHPGQFVSKVHTSFNFVPVTSEDVIKYIKETLHNKATHGLDTIPSSILKDSSLIIVESLQHCAKWKEVCVRITPLYKGADCTNP